MKTGPRPAPTALKLVTGVKPSRINDDEPQPADQHAECPAEAPTEIREIWDYTARQLDEMRVLTAADRDALYAYCAAVALHRAATRALTEFGLTCPGPSGPMAKHPMIQVQKDAASTIRMYAAEFGLTPSSRSTIKVTPSAEKRAASDPARLLSG